MTHTQNTRAGLIPYYIDDDLVVHVCLMVPSDPEFGGSEPQFAKGHIEGEESEECCAVREGVEELGITASDVIDVWRVTSVNKIAWFAAEMKGKKLDQPSYESEYSFWMTIGQAQERIREWQKQILQEFWFYLSRQNRNYLAEYPEFEEEFCE